MDEILVEILVAEFTMGNSLTVEVGALNRTDRNVGDETTTLIVDIYDQNGDDPDEVVESYEIDMESLIEFARKGAVN